MNTTTVVLQENELPEYDLEDNPTGCCPKFKPDEWDNREVHFNEKLFVRAKTRSFMHVPLNMGKVFKQISDAIECVDAADMKQFVVLSRELSSWSAEHCFAVSKVVPGQEMVRISGHFLTKVFEGPFSDAPKWCRELETVASHNSNKRDGSSQYETHYFYTTCPKCAKVYGKNYVVGFVRIS